MENGTRRDPPLTADLERRGLTLRRHLLLLALSALVPVVVFSILLGWLVVRQERETFHRGAMDRTRAVMTAVDAELRGTVAALRSLAASNSLRNDDLRAFHAEATLALRLQPDWLTVILLNPAGAQVVNAVRPFGGSPVLQPVERASLERATSTLQPAVGDVASGPFIDQPGVPVRLPLTRDGKLVYVLTAVVNPRVFGSLLEAQRLPSSWVIGLADRRQRFVARVPALAPGTPTAGGFAAALLRGGEGTFRAKTVEGQDTYQWYVTSPFSGWGTGLAVPATVVHAPAWRAAGILAAGVLAALALALLAAFFVARRIEKPVVSLAAAADAIAAGAVAPAAVSGVREVAAVAAALERAGLAVRERDRSKDEFLATLSHELRNPLAAIAMSAQALRRGAGRDAVASIAEILVRQSRHMASLVEDLLDISRITFGKVELAKRPLELRQILERIAQNMRASGRLERHALSVEPGAPAWIEADPVRLEQIINNLLDNSVKFTPPGGIITLRVDAQGDEVTLAISDTGKGFTSAEAERIFEVFVQGEQAIHRPSGGLGIGLALVKRLVELHGGRVRISSPGPGQGSTCTLGFPRAAPAAAETPASAQPPRRRTVLIVEDNDDARAMLALALQQDGHEVLTAHDGPSALAIGEPPQVALLDIGLPGMSGYELARALRARFGSRVALVALSGYGQPEDQRRGAEAGFDAWLTKPVDMASLNAVFARLD